MTEPITLHVRVESSRDFHEAVLDGLAEMDDESVEPTHVLSLPDEESLARILSPRNLELLRAIADREPSSMRESARLVDRDIKDVSRNLNELHELGLVEFEETGRAKRPIVEFDRIVIDVPITGDARPNVAPS